MKKFDYFGNILISMSAMFLTLSFYLLSRHITELEEKIKNLENKVEVIDSYHFEHSQIK